jgi:nucleotide-binding universal stress UspA family protein
VDLPKDETPLSILEQQTIEVETINKLSTLAQKCLEKKVPYSVVVIPSVHPGKTLCSVAEEHGAHHLVVGRRNMTPLKRMIIASTSKYCIENAPCTVTVVKRAWPAEPRMFPGLDNATRAERSMATERPINVTYKIQVPSPKVDQSVQTSPSDGRVDNAFGDYFSHVALEEAEWNRYMNDNAMNLKESRDNLELTKLMEDKERQERVAEAEASKVRDVEERQKIKEFVKMLEEEERRFRLFVSEADEYEESIERKDAVRAWAREVEEEERASRTAVSVEDLWSESPQRAAEARRWAREVEEQERSERLREDEDVYNSSSERQRRLRKVKADEEVERQRRIQKMQLLIEEEEAQQADASLIDLERVKMLEEVERQYRIENPSKDRVFSETNMASVLEELVYHNNQNVDQEVVVIGTTKVVDEHTNWTIPTNDQPWETITPKHATRLRTETVLSTPPLEDPDHTPVDIEHNPYFVLEKKTKREQVKPAATGSASV